MLPEFLHRDPATITPAMMTYDLRRLRLQGLIEPMPHTHRHMQTAWGAGRSGSTTRPMTASCAPGLYKSPTPPAQLHYGEPSTTWLPGPDWPHKRTPKSIT